MSQPVILKKPSAPGTVLVLVTGKGQTEDIFRIAKQKARSLRVQWKAIYIETPHNGKEKNAQILTLLMLAEQLGAEIVHAQASTVFDGLVSLIKEYETNYIPVKTLILTKERSLWNLGNKHFNLYHKLIKVLDPKTEITVVPLDKSSSFWVNWIPSINIDYKEILYAILATLIATMIVELFRLLLPDAVGMAHRNKSIIYITACTLIAGRYGLLPGLVTAITSFMVMNIIYVVPTWTDLIRNTTDSINLGLFLVSSIVMGLFVNNSQHKTENISIYAKRVNALFQLHRVTLIKSNLPETVEALHQELSKLLNTKIAIFLTSPVTPSSLNQTYPQNIKFSERETLALILCWQKGEKTGAGSPDYPDINWHFVPLITVGKEIGVLGIFINKNINFDIIYGRLLSALADQIALIIERRELGLMMEESRVNEEREKLRSMLLSSVSHDLKTPLASVIGALSVVMSMRAKLSEEQCNILMNTALEEAQRLDSFITNILDMTRLESGDIDFKKEWESSKIILKNIAKRLRHRMGQHMLVIHSIPQDIAIFQDITLIEQVLQNLLDNAVKYTAPGTKIEISYGVRGRKFFFEIRDHGQGISPESLDKIFDKYARLNQTDKKVAGTGLGLAICKSIMMLQDGDIVASNHPDGGAVFTIYIPKWRKIRLIKTDV
ncbi:MAG: DUF4118 domain-containing protein [Alphaproteobacteria bacterium]|nr:DUF4118 domain-containing protein [Alphaproteobacteria bacterium]